MSPGSDDSDALTCTEVCDGSNPKCPVDDKQPITYPCRQAGGPCDIAEFCDHMADTCPAIDKIKTAGTICKAAGVSAVCDPTDICDGIRKLCPAKYAPAGTSCGGAMTCTGGGICR